MSSTTYNLLCSPKHIIDMRIRGLVPDCPEAKKKITIPQAGVRNFLLGALTRYPQHWHTSRDIIDHGTRAPTARRLLARDLQFLGLNPSFAIEVFSSLKRSMKKGGRH